MPLNGSIAFMKDGDVYVSSDHWKIVVNFDFADYEEVITLLRADITKTQQIAERATPLAEIQQVEMQLNSLEAKLAVLKEFLPRAEPRRGLINAGGSVLRALFKTATLMDLTCYTLR
jgi:hypothetical protein